MKNTIAVMMVMVAATAMAVARVAEAGDKIERIFRPPEVTRGNINVMAPGYAGRTIDDAEWIWHPDFLNENQFPDPRVLRFRKTFTVKDAARVEIDVSGDERFYLTCDGEFVARGPNRSTVNNWQYQSYALTLDAGEHTLEAVVWQSGENAPLAQLTYRGGFWLKAHGGYDAALTTGKAKWEVGVIDTIKVLNTDKNGVWGTGAQFEITGTGQYAALPADYREAVKVINIQRRGGGLRRSGWMLFPSQIPDQTEDEVRPGEFRAATHAAEWRGRHTYTEAETKADELAKFNALLKDGKEVVIPANTRLQLAWDLGVYHCAYPELVMSGGADARVAWCWTESARGAESKRKEHRGEIIGKYLDGYGDNFVMDGRDGAKFSTPWFRCGKWCRLDIETKDAPLTIKSIAMIESRYPIALESEFAAPQAPDLKDIRRICERAIQMCSHEMLFDCPYYEQQMYPGDTRVQLLIHGTMSRDDRMIKRAIELYNLATRDDGMVPFNWPTRWEQEGGSYTLCYLMMFGDYVMNHQDVEWLRARLQNFRQTMAGIEYYENADGLLTAALPGWNFMDWTVGWAGDGMPRGLHPGEGGLNAELNLFWSLAMRSAAVTERALGHEGQARYWEEKRAKLNAAIIAAFWDEARGLLADTPERKDFSEHAQALALIGDVLPHDKAQRAFGHLIEDEDLKRCTVYFTYYLFETYFKFGRGDLFLKRLDLWRDYLKRGVTTLLEMPDEPNESRSDCHAWGAHPIWFMQTGFAGINSDAPFFARVRIAPAPGPLTSLHVKHPHPQGWIEANLDFKNGGISGKISTPVPGILVWKGKEIPLADGDQTVTIK